MKKITITLVILLFIQMITITPIIANDMSNPSVDMLSNRPANQFGIVNHKMTLEEVEQLKLLVGVYDKNKNYNQVYEGLGTGLAPPSNEEWNTLIGEMNVVDGTLVDAPLSASFDLSSDPCFPIVRSQGNQGSCAAWAATYYAAGYLQAKDNDWVEASLGNNNQLLSPAFTYNKCNGGFDSGSHTWTNGYIMQDVGVCRWSDMPYDDTDNVSWGDENAWRDAPQYRINDIYMLNAYFDDSDITIIKNAVSSGYPVVFALNANSYLKFGADAVLGLNAMVSGYNHANTIVGFDDSVVDIESGEVGAFKCVNSWGSTWGPNHNGYYWMTYNAFRGPQNVYPVCWFSDLYTTDEPSVLGVWEYSQQPDRDASIELGIGSYSSPLETFSPWLDGDSRVMHAYPSFMCLDISSFYDEWSSGENNFYLELGDASSNDGVISSFTVEYYQNSYIPGYPTRTSSESIDTPSLTPGYVTVNFPYSTEPNKPPYKPIDPSPYDGEFNVLTNPTLSVTVSDPDGNLLDVSFYNASDDSLIGTDENVLSGDSASVEWDGLSFETMYYWYAVASDTDFSNRSITWSFTTQEPQPEKFYATQDIIVYNGGITGSYLNTRSSDDSYIQIDERESGGKPSNRYSYLEHKWSIPVTGGLQYYEFSIEAYHTINTENDDFIISYSLNDINYIDMMTITKTIDDDSYQVYVLPTTLSGMVYIKVKDLDQTQGNRNLDSILIDHMYIEGTGTPPPNRAPNKPSNPSPYNTELNVDINPTLSVYVYDPDEDVLDVTFYNASDGSIIGTDENVLSGDIASVEWAGLSFETTYDWYAVAEDSGYATSSDHWSFTTRGDIPTTDMFVSNISGNVKTAGKNVFLSYIVTVGSIEGVVSDAVVYSTLTNNNTGQEYPFTGVTDGAGKVTFEQKVPLGKYTVLVTDITHITHLYNAELDVDNPYYIST